MNLTSNAVGTAGELRVMSELLLRGFNPAKSYLDNGVDIILEDGRRIQVKTAMKQSERKNGHLAYNFSLEHLWHKEKAELSKTVDFLICVVPAENLFFIIPTRDWHPLHALFISVNGRSKYNKFRNNWQLLKEEL